jgi:DNA-binding beta-propeller fold protein YncE
LKEFLWANSEQGTGQVYKVNVATNLVVALVDAYPGVHGSAFDGQLLWVVCSDTDAVVKIDVRTNQVVGVIQMPAGAFPHDIVFDRKFMWVAGEGRDQNNNLVGKVHKYFARL